jgi:hypothetical protein
MRCPPAESSDPATPPSPPVRLREVAAVALVGVVLAVATTWPLVLHMARVTAPDLGDPLLNAWILAWEGHALRTDPTRLYQSNAFHPEPDSLAFTESFAGYAPISTVGSGLHAATIRYNAILLGATALAFVGAWLLARELGAGRASWLAAAAFGFSPFRLGQLSHLHVLSTGGIPLSLFLLVRGVRRRRAGLVLAGWLVAAWQLSLGFTYGLPLALLVAILAAGVAVSRAIRGRPRLGPGVAAAALLGAALFGGWAWVQSRPYLRVVARHPEAIRSFEAVRFFSPTPRSLLAADPRNFIWGGLTARFRTGAPGDNEKWLFPGAATVVLAAVGLLAGRVPVRLRAALGAGAAAVTVLALGASVGGRRGPYGIAYDLLPGWRAFRTPGRLFAFATLALALLAAVGAARLLPQGTSRRARRLGACGLALTMGLIVLEGSGQVPQPAVPMPPAGLERAAEPRYHLPSSPFVDHVYLFWSVEGFPRLVNGYGGFEPASLERIRRLTERFPDRTSVEALRRIGVRTVVVHLDLVPGTPWADVAERSVAGLPLTVERAGSLLLFHIEPSGASGATR